VVVLMERQRYLNRCLEAELNDKEMNFFGVFYLYQVLVLLIPSPARIIISTSATWPISDQKGDLLWFALGLVEVRRLKIHNAGLPVLGPLERG